MQTSTLTVDPRGPVWLRHLVGAALFIGVAVALYGVLISVEYRWAKVLDVSALAGRSANHRMVLIETPERLRVLRTSDRLLRIEKGTQVCVAKRRFIARNWLRYSVELPGYCRNQPRYQPLQAIFSVDEPFSTSQ